MANTITGKIGLIYPTQTIPSKNGGNPVIKRECVIRAIRFNQEDGTPELSERNTPIFEVNGEDRVGMLDNFNQGDIVKVSFAVEGRCVKNQDGTFKFFNSVRALRIEKLNITLPEPANTTSTAATNSTATQSPQGQQASQAPVPSPAQAAQAPQQSPVQAHISETANYQPPVDELGNPLPF